MEAARVVGEGDASVTLTKLKVGDEGTYICTVSLGHFHAQQVIQLHVLRKFQFHCLNFRKFHRISFNTPSVALCFRTTPCFTLRGEAGFEGKVTSDSELPLH